MHRFFTPVLRCLYSLLAVTLAAFYTIPAAQTSRWHREKVFLSLENGDRKMRFQAAQELAATGGQEQLLRALQSHSREVQAAAATALFDLWLGTANEEAREMFFTALNSFEQRDYRHALFLFTLLTQTHPDFAEAWNRRAVIELNLGRVDRALADARRAVVLNPANFAAWQGIAVCQMRRGNYDAAIHALRSSLRLVPYDAGSRNLLRRCHELRARPKNLPPPRRSDIV